LPAPRLIKSVLVVDDHPVVRKGVASVIDDLDNLGIVGTAGDGAEAIDLAETLHPDVVVLDLRMAGLGGVETIVELRRRRSRAEFLVFTLHQSEHLCAEALAAGARGYVCKSESEHLVPALEAVSRGERYLSPIVREAIPRSGSEEQWDWKPLTTRERQIVRLVAEGYSSKQISRLLNISVKTTETHRASAMRKTGSNSASQLTIYAARNGIVEL
jgi:DNA-binding NarL/FixJ family response regulator